MSAALVFLSCSASAASLARSFFVRFCFVSGAQQSCFCALVVGLQSFGRETTPLCKINVFGIVASFLQRAYLKPKPEHVQVQGWCQIRARPQAIHQRLPIFRLGVVNHQQLYRPRATCHILKLPACLRQNLQIGFCRGASFLMAQCNFFLCQCVAF